MKTVEERRAYQRNYYAKNRAKMRAYFKNYWEQNLDKSRRLAREAYHRSKNKKDRAQLREYWRQQANAKYARMTPEQKANHHAKSKRYMSTHPETARRYYLREYEKQKQRMATDPAFRDKLKSRRRAVNKKIRSDPVKRERLNANKRLSYHRNKKPPTDQRRRFIVEYSRKRRATDPQFRIRSVLTCRVRASLRGIAKASSTESLTGCDWRTLVKHIESLWMPGMSWDNYGRGKGQWSVDHIKPCAAFDLTDVMQQKICFHYSNLRPLWHYDNQSKGSLWDGVRHRYKRPETTI